MINTQWGDTLFHNIEVERKKSGITKEELSAFLGISLKTYYNWLNGKNPIPHTVLVKLKGKFNVSIDYLIEEKKNAILTKEHEKPQKKKESIDKLLRELEFFQNA